MNELGNLLNLTAIPKQEEIPPGRRAGGMKKRKEREAVRRVSEYRKKGVGEEEEDLLSELTVLGYSGEGEEGEEGTDSSHPGGAGRNPNAPFWFTGGGFGEEETPFFIGGTSPERYHT
jgi:hypothetical protein